MKVPSKMRKILAEGETIEATFELKNCRLYATDRRLIEVKGETIRDFDYAHVSSVGYSSKRYRWLIVVGILIIIGGIVATNLASGVGGITAGAVVGIILIILGVVLKSERFEVTVVGLSQPLRYKGSKQNLDSLLRVIRQK